MTPKGVAPQRDRFVMGRPNPDALIKLMEQWMQEDEVEQRETFEYLRRSLDEARPPGYKLFS